VLTAVALPYAIPAAVAGLAYLNARHALTYDLGLLRPLIYAQVIAAKLHERRDDYNLFYTLESQAKSSNADHTWIIFEGQRYTYAQAYETVLKYGTWLKSKGVQKEEIVAMDFMNSEVFIWVWFGLWSIGAKPAFINYNLTGKPLLHTIRTSSARLVLVGEESREKFAEDVMVENGFNPSPIDEGVSEGRQARYGFENSPDDMPSAVRKPKRRVTSQPVDSESQRENSKLELVFFDEGLESYISSLQPIRQPNSERGNQAKHDLAMLIFTSGMHC
jgi:acyl-CoA synthetase (AMP-forming)/AMP-acid ligase II